MIDFEKLKERSGSIGDKIVVIGFIATFFNQFDGVSFIGGFLTMIIGFALIFYGVKK